jgi:signal transduction histidine kinase
MKCVLQRLLIIYLFLLVAFEGHAQNETQRWWNTGAIAGSDRTVFCADIEVSSIDELKQSLEQTSDAATRMQIYLRIVRRCQEESLIPQAVNYADSALQLATLLKDSLAICRVHIASVYNMDMSGNSEKMFEQAQLARKTIPRSVRGTIEEFKINVVSGDAYYSLRNYENAEKAYYAAKQIIKPFSYDKCMGYICMSLGKVYQNSGQLEQSMIEYLESIQIFESLKDTLTCCILYSKMAGVYADLGISEKQFNYLYKTLEMSEKLNDRLQQAAIYRGIGSFYKEQGDSVLTTEFYNKAIDAYLAVSDSSATVLGDSYNDMADFYFYWKNRDKALSYQARSIASYQAFPRPLAFAVCKMGNLYLSYGQLDSAFYYLNDAYQQSLSVNDLRLSVVCAKGMADYYDTIGNAGKTIDFAESAYEKAVKIQWTEQIYETSELLSKSYAAMNNFQKAYQYQSRHDRLGNSMKLAENSRTIARMSAQLEFADREAKMNMQISEQQQRIKQQIGITTLLTGILCLAVLLVFVVMRNNRQKRKVNYLLNDQKEELYAFNEELSVTNEELAAVNDELQKTYHELDGYKNDLEKMVDKKTSELQQALKQVQESDRFKAAFFANMSHEIRTPLNAILGFLQFIGSSTIGVPQQKQMVKWINANAAQLLSLVDDIVDLSKIDSGLLHIHPEECDIAELLEDVHIDAGKMLSYADKTRLELVVENRIPSLSGRLTIDGKRVKQVLLHLLNNAIKFTNTGYIQYGCEIPNDLNFLVFFVEDTGLGILPEHQSEIFKRFWKQGDDVYTQQYRGVGIGLPLCELLVEMMGGTFSFKSEPGQGSSFRFTVKIRK